MTHYFLVLLYRAFRTHTAKGISIGIFFLKEAEFWISNFVHRSDFFQLLTCFQITGNQNGYQASTTNVNIYNVRHIKIQSTDSRKFCLRFELCGEGENLKFTTKD